MNILITGGTGFFGRGFVRHLLKFHLSERICVFSRSEFAQATLRQELADDKRVRWFIGDVRDRDRLQRAMDGCEVVVHAAALKRVEVAEYNVLECVATNIYGTENVVKAAIDAKVKKTVLLSSDKAAEPANTYGLSKAVAEKIFLSAHHYAGPERTQFVVTRYGNVAGSTGSVIPYWRGLLRTQDWLPVTDPEATRFWMPLSAAINLVLDAILTSKGGEISIPQLPAYRLGDLAAAILPEHDRRLAQQVGHIRTVGMRPGEKLHEIMWQSDRTLDGAPCWLPINSSQARRMSVEELRKELERVE